MYTIISFKPPFLLELPPARMLLPLVIFAATFCGVPKFAAQTPSAHKQIHAREHLRTAHPQTGTPQAAPAPATPPASESPQWPVNEKPTQASVLWDRDELRITAQNSSLQQILQDVAKVTGTKVEGMGADERVFGDYGPGQACEVLAHLLEGSGYNVMMIGDQGQGAPRQIVLSTRPSELVPVAIKNAAANPRNEDAEADDEHSPADVNPGAEALPHTPQQLLQQIQQRRQAQQQAPPQN